MAILRKWRFLQFGSTLLFFASLFSSLWASSFSRLFLCFPFRFLVVSSEREEHRIRDSDERNHREPLQNRDGGTGEEAAESTSTSFSRPRQD